MKKLFLITVTVSILVLSCNNEGFTTSSNPVSFGENNTINLSSGQQDTLVKASYHKWNMAVEGVDKNEIEGDTIIGDWYELIKQNNGEYLLIKVDNNNDVDRFLTISINNENFYTHITLHQEGI